MYLCMYVCVIAYVGVILPYAYGTFTAELILVLIVGVAAAMQIHFGLALTYLINYLITYSLTYLPAVFLSCDAL